jgi:hypothetical protein
MKNDLAALGNLNCRRRGKDPAALGNLNCRRWGKLIVADQAVDDWRYWVEMGYEF